MSATTLAIDWPDLFRQAGIRPQKAKLGFSSMFKEWFLDVGDDTMRQVAAPEGAVRIEGGEWVIGEVGEDRMEVEAT